MQKPTKNELITLNLRYGQGAEPLRIRAFAQMAAKVFYLKGNERLRISQITKEVAAVLGCKDISRKAISQALSFLNQNGLVDENNDGWSLTATGKNQIGKDLARSNDRIENILERHFPTRIDRIKLRSWFVDCCVVFFGKYGDLWARSICRHISLQTTIPENLEEIINSITDKYIFDDDISLLSKGFREFVTSHLPEDSEQLWSVGQAMLASRLVAANIASDPITTKEIADSTILLDTNVLLVAALEKHTFAETFCALAKAIDKLKVRLKYLVITRNEYVKLLDYKSKLILHVASRYNKEILEESKDPFLRTALGRQCNTIEDYERFFATIMDPPTIMDDSSTIETIDFQELNYEVEKGIQDDKLKEGIVKVWSQFRKWQKKPHAVEHDAGLLYGGEYLRKTGIKCWVLTLDRTLHEFDLKRTGKKEYPLLISLDVLLQILALDNAGPDFDPVIFAPLMASIISHQLEPTLETYTIEDLEWLLEVEERCADLPNDKIENLAIATNQARLSGKPIDDPELRLQIQRAFQSEKLKTVNDLTQAKEIIRQKEDEIQNQVQKHNLIEQAYRIELSKELIRKARQKMILSLVLYLIIALGGIVCSIILALKYSANESPAVFWGILLTSFSLFAGCIYAIFESVLPRYRSNIKEIDVAIETQIQKLKL